jgi:hypothetical protein
MSVTVVVTDYYNNAVDHARKREIERVGVMRTEIDKQVCILPCLQKLDQRPQGYGSRGMMSFRGIDT